MYRHGLRTQETERSRMSHMDDVIDMLLSTFEAILSAVTIGDGIVDGGLVITKTTLRDVFFCGRSCIFY